MSRQEQVYVGPMLVDGDEMYGELWVQGPSAVVFVDNVVVLSMHDVELTNEEDGRLWATGLDADDVGHQVRALAAEQGLAFIVNATIEWADEPPWIGAAITASQHRVTVSKNGDRRTFAGASVRTYPREAFITLAQADDEIHVTLPYRSGCCGGR